MIKRLPLLVVAVALLGGCGGGKTDYQHMFSFWTVTSAEQGGKPADESKKQDIFIDSEVLTDGYGAIDVRWTSPPRHYFKLDPTKSPKQIDVSKPKGVSSYEVNGGAADDWVGIYELNGDDLKICVDLDGKTRPTEFKTKAGDNCLLLVLKRKQK